MKTASKPQRTAHSKKIVLEKATAAQILTALNISAAEQRRAAKIVAAVTRPTRSNATSKSVVSTLTVAKRRFAARRPSRRTDAGTK